LPPLAGLPKPITAKDYFIISQIVAEGKGFLGNYGSFDYFDGTQYNFAPLDAAPFGFTQGSKYR
jgi:hypothetical protein